MGLRGPTRDPLSRRGLQENEGSGETVIQNAPEPPTWLSAGEKSAFNALVQDAIASGIPILKIDDNAFAMVTRLRVLARKEKEANSLARIMRTLLPWETAAGMNAVGRARLGIKQTAKKRSATLQLLDSVRRA